MAVYLGTNNVDLFGGQPTGGSGPINLQTKSVTYTPTTSEQTDQIIADEEYDGLEEVDVTIDAVTTGTAGTPTATKGTVSSHSVTVTPSVTNVEGYISGGTITGTGVSVAASELVSGTKSITSSGSSIDVTDYAAVSVASGVATAPSTISGSSATVSTGTNALILSKTVSVTPSITTAGYISSGTAGNSSISLTASVNIRTSSDLTSSGDTITAPAGYYGSSASKSVSSGSAGTPTATKGTVSNHSITVTPSVTNTTGYITGGTKTGTGVSVSASELVSGNLPITSNGTNINVADYSTVSVNVPGGGSSSPDLLATKSIGTVSTTSTTAANLNQDVTVSGINDYDLLIVEASVNIKTNGRHAATTRLIWLTASSSSVGTKNGSAIATATWNCRLSSNGTATTVSGTTPYGVYANSCTISNGTATIPMYRRYNSTTTTTINGTYTARVYGVKIYDLIGG